MSYVMPKVQVGDDAVWHIEGVPDLASAQAAKVTGIHPSHIDLVVFVANGSPIIKTSVRHITDPYLVESRNPRSKRENGGWDYSPQTKRLMAVEAALEDIKRTPKSK
jgi:hypothetical protein